jgi:hypothetical protein
MSTIVTRAGKGSALTHTEVDANFTNLNTDKIEAAQTVTLTNKTLSTGTAITAGTINGATIGATTPSSGAFTTLSASSTVSGTGFSTYLASPPAIGGTAAAAGSFTTLSATGVTTVQAGTAAAPAITTSGDTNTGIFFPAADTIAFAEGGIESVRFDSSGNVSIANGNLVISTSGKGIDFSATPGTGTSELLADYEEGTWTPAVQGSTTPGTTTYAVQTGRYTKIGRQVTAWFYLSVNSATGTGALTITGLPFTSASENQVAGALMTDSLNWSGGTSLVTYMSASSASIYIYISGDDIAWSQQTVVNEVFLLIGTITYFV